MVKEEIGHLYTYEISFKSYGTPYFSSHAINVYSFLQFVSFAVKQVMSYLLEWYNLIGLLRNYQTVY